MGKRYGVLTNAKNQLHKISRNFYHFKNSIGNKKKYMCGKLSNLQGILILNVHNSRNQIEILFLVKNNLSLLFDETLTFVM